jgi:sortase A
MKTHGLGRRLGIGVAVVLFVVGAVQLGHGLYILGKAQLAQVLIEQAWQSNQRAGTVRAQPWAWADTSPIARLGFVRQRQAMVVLSGDSGRILAFGPGHRPNSPMPATGGNAVISGHRDTHFSVLESVTPGDRIWVQTLTGDTVHYEVQGVRVVHKSQVGVTGDNGFDELTLVTCWPFDALDAGGPERLVVSARRAADNRIGLASGNATDAG